MLRLTCETCGKTWMGEERQVANREGVLKAVVPPIPRMNPFWVHVHCSDETDGEEGVCEAEDVDIDTRTDRERRYDDHYLRHNPGDGPSGGSRHE